MPYPQKNLPIQALLLMKITLTKINREKKIDGALYDFYSLFLLYLIRYASKYWPWNSVCVDITNPSRLAKLVQIHGKFFI